MEVSPVERSDALLDPVSDPGGGAMGPLGDGSVETNWFVLLHRRVSARAVRSPRYQWWALVALLAGLLSLNITFTVFVVALPTVKADFHTNFSVLAWASTGPLLAFGVAAPFFGKAGDLFGHRRLYQFGLLGAMVSAILTATAPDVGMLLFARALDGVQGAATGTASMAIILELFAPEDRVKALGWWSLVGAGGPVLGVTLGSPVIQFFGWRTLFWGQLVLLVIASVVVALLLPSGRRDRAAGAEGHGRSRVWEGMDWVGSWSLAGGVTAAMLVLSIGPIVGWTSPAVIVAGVAAVGLAGVFVWRETTFATPLVPTTYWRRRNFMFPMGSKSFSSFAYFGGFFLFPLLMEQVYGYSVSQVGFISVARPLLFAVSAPIAGYMAVRTGERTATLFGTGALFLSMVLFATLAPIVGAAGDIAGPRAVGPRHGRVDAGHLGDHVERVGRLGVRRDERGAAPGHPGRGGGGDPGRADHPGVDRAQLGPRQRPPQHGAVAQLQRPLLGGCRHGRAGGGVRALHPAAAPARPPRAAGGRPA